MAEKKELAFDPQKSRRAQQLLSMSSKQLFDRYFVRTNGDNKWLPDFNKELNKKNSNDEYIYSYSLALLGNPLEYIPSLINLKFVNYTPAGYKFNGPALLQDMEVMLKENPAQARRAAAQVNSTLFIIEMGDFFVERINHGLDYSYEC